MLESNKSTLAVLFDSTIDGLRTEIKGLKTKIAKLEKAEKPKPKKPLVKPFKPSSDDLDKDDLAAERAEYEEMKETKLAPWKKALAEWRSFEHKRKFAIEQA